MEYTMKVKTDDRLVLFIYDLLQQGTHVHDIEKAVDAANAILKPGCVVELANGPLAVVAQEVARILAGSGTIKVSKENGVVCSKCGAVYFASDYHKLKQEQDGSACPKCNELWNKEGVTDERGN